MTAADGFGDYNTVWQVKEAERDEVSAPCKTGKVIKCGDRVRFEHNLTGKNLHSHTGFYAPLSNRQEVSGYGDNGDGDLNDDWLVECNNNYAYGPVNQTGDVVSGKSLFYLKHMGTDQYLTMENGF